MSRLDDIIELIQTTNEVYFITAPGRVRTAYILVDDIVELSLKIFLQEKTQERRTSCRSALELAGIICSNNHRKRLREYFEEDIDINALSTGLGMGASGVATLQIQLAPFEPLQHWSANDPEARKLFDDVIDEVRNFFPLLPSGEPDPMSNMLDEVLSRHKRRNKFYHDHQQVGVTINDDQCLHALCSMFDLIGILFPGIAARIQENKNKIIRCQIGVLRLKLAAHGSQDLKEPYNKALEQLERSHRITKWSDNFEHSILHTVSESFFITLREQLREAIAQRQRRIDKINGMRKPNPGQRAELADNQRLMIILNQQLADIESLVSSS
ncbi:hypothetical protein NDI39_05955 [Microcoleus sp. ZQ-A2]|nr:hypothetical protein [Microcoleus sp. FACHB-1]